MGSCVPEVLENLNEKNCIKKSTVTKSQLRYHPNTPQNNVNSNKKKRFASSIFICLFNDAKVMCDFIACEHRK